VVLVVLIFVVTEIITFASFFGQALISSHAPIATIGDPLRFGLRSAANSVVQ
jgi:hypothetical protein